MHSPTATALSTAHPSFYLVHGYPILSSSPRSASVKVQYPSKSNEQADAKKCDLQASLLRTHQGHWFLLHFSTGGTDLKLSGFLCKEGRLQQNLKTHQIGFSTAQYRAYVEGNPCARFCKSDVAYPITVATLRIPWGSGRQGPGRKQFQSTTILKPSSPSGPCKPGYREAVHVHIKTQTIMNCSQLHPLHVPADYLLQKELVSSQQLYLQVSHLRRRCTMLIGSQLKEHRVRVKQELHWQPSLL